MVVFASCCFKLFEVFKVRAIQGHLKLICRLKTEMICLHIAVFLYWSMYNTYPARNQSGRHEQSSGQWLEWQVIHNYTKEETEK